MHKSKWFAIIGSMFVLSASGAAFAQTSYFDPPSLVVAGAAQPLSGAIPSGAMRVAFTRFDVTARGTDMIIDEIAVAKAGISDDEAFEDILLLDSEGTVLGEASIEDGLVRFTDPIYVLRNETLRLIVAADMAEDLSEFEGQTAGFTVTDIRSHGYVPLR